MVFTQLRLSPVRDLIGLYHSVEGTGGDTN